MPCRAHANPHALDLSGPLLSSSPCPGESPSIADHHGAPLELTRGRHWPNLTRPETPSTCQHARSPRTGRSRAASRVVASVLPCNLSLHAL
jgi:hypothetical protein